MTSVVQPVNRNFPLLTYLHKPGPLQIFSTVNYFSPDLYSIPATTPTFQGPAGLRFVTGNTINCDIFLPISFIGQYRLSVFHFSPSIQSCLWTVSGSSISPGGVISPISANVTFSTSVSPIIKREDLIIELSQLTSIIRFTTNFTLVDRLQVFSFTSVFAYNVNTTI